MKAPFQTLTFDFRRLWWLLLLCLPLAWGGCAVTASYDGQTWRASGQFNPDAKTIRELTR